MKVTVDTIALKLTLNGFIALGAGLLARAVGERVGLFVPIAIGMAAQIAAAYALPVNPGAVLYGASAIGFTFALIFVVPYYKALFAKIDSSGRLAGIATAFITLGSAAGPAVTGYALNQGADYKDAAIIACSGLAVAWGLAVIVLRSKKFALSAAGD